MSPGVAEWLRTRACGTEAASFVSLRNVSLCHLGLRGGCDARGAPRARLLALPRLNELESFFQTWMHREVSGGRIEADVAIAIGEGDSRPAVASSPDLREPKYSEYERRARLVGDWARRWERGAGRWIRSGGRNELVGQLVREANLAHFSGDGECVVVDAFDRDLDCVLGLFEDGEGAPRVTILWLAD